MKIIKKYTAIILNTEKDNNNDINVILSYGRTSGPYYSVIYPEEEFDTEQDALEYAYNTNKYGRWLILPVIKFDNF